jgi:phosphatidyl-myo-inositol dimannoside synthase
VNRPMSQLLLSEIFPPKIGGSGRWFWEVYRRLPRPDYVIAAGRDPRQEAFDHTHDLRLYRVPLTMKSWGVRSFKGLAGYWRALRALRSVIRAERVERLHCARCLPEGLMARVLRARSGISYICYVHGEEVTYATSRELRYLAQWGLYGADFVIANSRNTARLLQEEWDLPAERIRLLYPGVDTGRFVPAPRDPEVRSQLSWGNRPVVLTVGRLQKRKGHDQMIRAVARARSAVPDLLYAIVGDGEERPALQALVEQEGLGGHVQFLGELDDRGLITCYQQCDLFVLPNRQVGKDIEGFGMVLLEAQACGKPVLAGDSGGTAETMRIPETGRVVNCDGPEDLACLVADLLSDGPLLERMGTAARAWVVSQFDWSALSRQAEQLFRSPSAGRV